MRECVVRMEMPKDNCEIAVEIPYVGDWCPILAKICDYSMTKKMPKDCPILCQLPEGHGRLVDADALLRDIEQYHVSDGRFQHWLELQPTIVPAEKREHERTETVSV